MAGLAWSDDEIAFLRATVEQMGRTGAAVQLIADRLGRTWFGVRQKIDAFRAEDRTFGDRPFDGCPPATPAMPRRAASPLRPPAPESAPAPAPLDDAAVWRIAREATERRDAHLAATFDWLRPVALPPIEYPRAKAAPRRYTIVAGDSHWPLEDPRAMSILFQVVAALRPWRFVHAGDGPDMMSISKYPKPARRSQTWTLGDEQRGAKSFWRRLAELGAPWGIELVELEANHSGNERASRWRRFLDDAAGVLFTLDGAEEALDYRRFFHPEGVPVSLVEEVIIAPRAAEPLRIRHGEIVRKHGGYSARAHGDKWHASVMHGHTHRVGASMKRVPGIPGVRPDSCLRTFEIGCLCKVDAEYAPGADWTQGFAIIAESDDDYGVELVTIENGRATIATLGATLTAQPVPSASVPAA